MTVEASKAKVFRALVQMTCSTFANLVSVTHLPHRDTADAVERLRRAGLVAVEPAGDLGLHDFPSRTLIIWAQHLPRPTPPDVAGETDDGAAAVREARRLFST